MPVWLDYNSHRAAASQSVSVLVRTKHELHSLVVVVKQLDHQAVMGTSPGECSCPEQQSTQGQEHFTT